mgnify:CR=1 FL=1
MCAATSATSPTSGSISTDDGADFDGALDLRGAWCDGIRPDPDLTVSSWADRHRMLSQRASAEPGLYRTDRTPYMRAIMDALSPQSQAQRVVFMKSAQVGATEAGLNWLGFIIHHAPGPALLVMPTVETAKRNSRQRIDPMIEDTPALREKILPARARDSGNTVLSKDFPGGVLVMTGANSAVGLRSMPARYLMLDEVDGYPASVDEEGDPISIAEARARTYAHRRKVLIVSTPTVAGVSRVEQEWEKSDQRRYMVPCPECGGMQWLQFQRLNWAEDRPDDAHYVCEHCDARIEERHKTWMLANGEWTATSDHGDGETVGFHINGLYSPVGWLSWSEIARQWLAATTDDARRVFTNTILGETWRERGDAPDWARIYERRETWPDARVPAGALFLTAGVDLQADRLEISVWAWGRGLESWWVAHDVLDGSPDGPEVWSKLDAYLDRTWLHATGGRVGIAKCAIDTGYHPDTVYAYVREGTRDQVCAIKGAHGWNRTIPVSGPTYVDMDWRGRKVRRGARLWTVAVNTYKAQLYGDLRLARPTDEALAAGDGYPPRYVHIPAWIDAEEIQQLVAEQLVTVANKHGQTHREWQKLRERNETLDCRVYARAAATILGVDHWPERQWAALEQQVIVEQPAQTEDEAGATIGVMRPGRGARASIGSRRPSVGGGREKAPKIW